LSVQNEQWARRVESDLQVARESLSSYETWASRLQTDLQESRRIAANHEEWALRVEAELSSARVLSVQNEQWARRVESDLQVARKSLSSYETWASRLQTDLQESRRIAANHEEWALRVEAELSSARMLSAQNEQWASNTERLLRQERSILEAIFSATTLQDIPLVLTKKATEDSRILSTVLRWNEQKVANEAHKEDHQRSIETLTGESLILRKQIGTAQRGIEEVTKEISSLRLTIAEQHRTIKNLAELELHAVRKQRAITREYDQAAKIAEEERAEHRRIVTDLIVAVSKRRVLLPWFVGIASRPAILTYAESRLQTPDSRPVPNEPGTGPSITVILCTRNPVRNILEATLSSLAAQSIAASAWEFILVDNGSIPPLEADILTSLPTGISRKLVREPEPGLSAARVAGFLAACGSIIICIDDDNFFHPDYLTKAAQIADKEPELGTWGGVSEPIFEQEPVPWVRPLLEHLAIRNYGNDPITSKTPEWGKWDPIGAGMVLRRQVAMEFVSLFKNQDPAVLGRTGQLLLGGEDTLLNRIANRLGFACSYQPTLYLHHHIKANRVSPRYLRKLLYGQGITHVRLLRILGQVNNLEKPRSARAWLRDRWRIRQQQYGKLLGPIQWRWDLGFLYEINQFNKERS
jgi:glycosyltransferase involved in cell wall biosynthesis